MHYDFKYPSDAENRRSRSRKAQRKARTRLEYLIKRQSEADITEKRAERDAKRTHRQNNLFHLWVSVIADETGYTDKESCKRDVKRTVLGTKEEVNRLTGEILQVDYRTSQMTTSELASFMDRMKAWAATDLGIYLPYPEEPGYEEMYRYYRNR